MPTDGGPHRSNLEDRVRLVIVDSPDAAAPLVSALDAAEVVAWMWVEAERALYFSPRVLDLLGLPLEPQADLLRRFLHCVHLEDRQGPAWLLHRQMPDGSFECRYRFT